MGQANGVTMMMGCELSVVRWVKSPVRHRVAEIRAAQRGLHDRRKAMSDYALHKSTRTEIEQCCPNVRFMGSQLQQLWSITWYEAGKAVEQRSEWRNVPIVHPADEL
jgi:hypothetical protein